ncbi:MAG: TetR/AcrR family transcriptional regulator [Myxococcales bacterium]|nr:TetR/AcrR family transcriptional regulator [Myxococcales bacterium]
MELLRTRGVGGVRVLTLAQKLGVSRGSFYWHFEDRQDLLSSMLEWWEGQMTDTVIELDRAGRASPRKRLMTIAERILEADLNRYDASVRSWALDDRNVKKALRRVIRKRVDYVSNLFEQAGFTPAEARTKGDLLAVYLMSESTVHMGETLDSRRRLVRRHVRSLTNEKMQ